ncbi:oxygen-insensitive NADPH nitroreductase [Paenibacillus koleovorans]|uniref:oxygen-insensitive NADPH nitroreductase n=1 Tax=Paenibacillus koleovorans TaxID=121608 RepID=UPI000FDBDC49|nr:oxygen-insensitive NADPH nitroreductase [Paenibacillus koleovorans]
MKELVDLLHAHRSIRKFKSTPVPDEVVAAILQSAQSASTSSNVQAYSVIRVTDPRIRAGIQAVTGNQQAVGECPLFLVWCADLHRNKLACEWNGASMVSEGMENFIIATVDTTLAGQNAAVAAEALGLGVVYIGGIRNDLREVTRLLQLPELVYPVFGMCIGYPDHDPGQKPRLSGTAVLHKNVYADDEAVKQGIQEYDERMHAYYLERTGGKRDTTWSNEMADKFKRKPRAYMKEYLEEQGFRLD